MTDSSRSPTFDLRLAAPFCVMADELHWGRAADRLGTSRRVVAAQVADLEQQLGVILLERHDRTPRLTSAGERFLRGARALVERAEDVACALGGPGPTLRIHLGEASNPVVRAVVAAFAAEHAEVTLEIVEGTNTASTQAVEAGTADVGFDLVDGVPGHLEMVVLDRQPLGVVTPRNHPVTAATTARWDALRGESIVVAPPGYAESYNAAVRRSLRRAGVRVVERVGPALPRLRFVASQVLSGQGVVVCTRYAFVPIPSELVWTELLPHQAIEIGVVWDAESHSSATWRFVELARTLSPLPGGG